MSHAEFSPSSASRWLACPGSIALSRGVGSRDNVYSRSGTFSHEISANHLLDGTDPVLGVSDGEFAVDEERAERIQTYLDYVRGYVLLYEGQLLVEQRVAVNDDVYGTADAIVLAGDVMHVIDLKDGAGFVAAEGNEQLLTYGLGALLKVQAAGHWVREVHLHIVQPRITTERPYRSAVVTADWLLDEWKPVLEEGVAAAKKPDAPLVAGEHCQWCPAKNHCPKLRENAMTVARSVFTDLTLTAAIKKPVSPANLTPEQIATVMAGKDLVETWLKGVTEMAFELAQQGTLPGWKLVAKLGLRKWMDEGAAQTTLTAAGIEPFAPAKLVSPAQAEKALTKRIGGTKAEALVETLAHKLVTGAALVPVSDPRPALNNASVFSAIPD